VSLSPQHVAFVEDTNSVDLAEKSKHMAVHIFVPRWMNQSITNAQNSNARALLSRFSDSRARWTALGYDQPPDAVTRNGVNLVWLSRSRLWRYQLGLAYQSRFDVIFYPGVDWADDFGMKVRRLSGRRTPVIATIEGIICDHRAVSRLSDLVGHPVFSQPGVEYAIPRIRGMYEMADHIIAISPFLARVAGFLYGNKVSYLPLGVESGVFHNTGRRDSDRCRVVGCGTVKSSKNPQMFLRLAARYKQADFVWYGDGPMVQSLTAEANQMGLQNLRFPGGIQPALLAEEFRKSSILVLPSHAEGVPKVTQEAAACGLPIVLNGYYEAPTVIHLRNGLVAWSDEELCEQVGALICDPETRRKMGEQGAEMAKNWDWDRIAPQWEELIIRLATSKAYS
jgi:glycosyltransferase involved in cell wall biosynthesis